MRKSKLLVDDTSPFTVGDIVGIYSSREKEQLYEILSIDSITIFTVRKIPWHKLAYWWFLRNWHDTFPWLTDDLNFEED